MLKICTKCNAEKPLDAFPDEAKRKDGKYPWCRECLSAHRKARYVKRSRPVFILNKVCTLCERDLPRSCFRTYEGNNLHYRCIDCEDEITEHEAKGEKKCTACETWKALAEFYPSHRDKTRAQCIECGKKYHKNNKLAIRNRILIKFYGINLEKYDQLVAKQNYTCPVCAEKLEPKNYSYTVDHAHSGKHRGKIRAIVHDRCNRHILWAHDDGRMLRAAANLVDNPLTDWLVPEKWIDKKLP